MAKKSESYEVARGAIVDCEQENLPMVLLTINEKGNLNVITNVPASADAIEALCRILDNAKKIIAQKVGN